MGHHRFKVRLEMIVVAPTEPQEPDAPVDPVLTADLIKAIEQRVKLKKSALDYVVKDVKQA